MKTALVTGVTGQDGSFLAEFLLEKGYTVYGLVRRSSTTTKERLEAIYTEPHLEGTRLFLEYGDLTEGLALSQLLHKIQPDEVYNLAAQSHVRISFDQPEYTMDTTGAGVLRVLEAIRAYQTATGKSVRFYQASSSEMFGSTPPPQGENTPFHPRSPYAVAKVAAFWTAVNYREAYGMFASNGILFNHESERRGENFVTRKITRAVGRIKVGLQKKLYLGNLDARRDWGYAKDYVEAMWMMLQHESPEDFVIATGESYSIRQFLEKSFSLAGLEWKDFVEQDPYYYRPSEVDFLQGDASKANELLGWRPKTNFDELVRIMTEHDMELAEREAHARSFVPSSRTSGPAS